jgi:Mor family transcriptional regulator
LSPIARDLGGTQPYIPTGRAKEAIEKADAIKREFNGHNHRRLAATYAVSESRVRQILAGGKASKRRHIGVGIASAHLSPSIMRKAR